MHNGDTGDIRSSYGPPLPLTCHELRLADGRLPGLHLVRGDRLLGQQLCSDRLLLLLLHHGLALTRREAQRPHARLLQRHSRPLHLQRTADVSGCGYQLKGAPKSARVSSVAGCTCIPGCTGNCAPKGS